MSVKVSIILPIYNADKFLDSCLDSLANQTLKEIEILAVDDGSTDNSLDILRAHAVIDPRIVVMSQENAGASAARNKAFSVAQGEYIGCVDADDWVEPNMFDLMYCTAKENDADIVLCGWQEYKSDQEILDHMVDCIPQNTLLEGDQYLKHVLPAILLEKIPGYLWNKLFRRSLISDNAMEKQYGLPNNSDWVFTCEIFPSAKSLIAIDVLLYHYRIHCNNSFSGQYRKTYFDNALILHQYRKQYLTEWQLAHSAEIRQGVVGEIS